MNKPPQRSVRPDQAGAAQPNGPPRSPEVERALVLRDVMDHAVRVQREISGAKVLETSRAGLIAACLVCVPLLGLCVYSYVARPEFIWGRGTTPAPVTRDAGLRFGMYLLAQRVESFRGRAGRYPESLEAIGDALEGVSYARISDSVFELRATQNGQAIVFRSSEPVDAFLGNSPELIQGGAR